jgi:hypothetical protein
MCKGCIASGLTINLLRIQLDRETARADKFEKLLLSYVGVSNESVADVELPKAIPGKLTWNEMRRKLEVRDMKRAQELMREPEGQEL